LENLFRMRLIISLIHQNIFFLCAGELYDNFGNNLIFCRNYRIFGAV